MSKNEFLISEALPATGLLKRIIGKIDSDLKNLPENCRITEMTPYGGDETAVVVAINTGGLDRYGIIDFQFKLAGDQVNLQVVLDLTMGGYQLEGWLNEKLGVVGEPGRVDLLQIVTWNKSISTSDLL